MYERKTRPGYQEKFFGLRTSSFSVRKLAVSSAPKSFRIRLCLVRSIVGWIADPAMKRILYLHRDPSFARFIRDDLDILREHYLVDDVRIEANARVAAKIARAALYADLVYFWWGDISGLGAATLAAILRKPSIMITG